ncbi:MAG: GNAT family N-acetyltransferase [Micrococcales bacterium]|nr:GNAT family N-acetyltransferase [Micrococcales bacterium]
MTPVIRSGRPDEADAVHELAAATFPLACPPGTTEADIAAFVAEHLSAERVAGYLADPQRRILVAERDGLLLGYTMLVLADPADPEVAAAVTTRPTAELSKCYLRPDAHGGGLAAALVEATVEEAARAGAVSVWLGVNQRNARANRFYEKSGFAVVGTKHFRVGAHLHDDFTRERMLRA